MRTLLWAERQKIRRSNIVWVAVFATILVAVIVFVGGRAEYQGPDSRFVGCRQIDNAGWYMSALQSWATFFVLPAVIALLGSYMICREEQDDTLKSLRLIPVNEAKLTTAKMIITFAVCELLYLLLFVIAFGAEAILHLSELSAGTIFDYLKEYFLDGIGVFLAISPIIALVSRKKKGYWLALVFTEMYSFVGLLAGMSSTLRTYYPIMAVFNFSGHYQGNVMISVMILLICSALAAILLIWSRHSHNE